ncbi:dienelactone hydrolase family protein [Candidatus Kapabacteria bacterium]|nr:dienelactone hydrolase family protein [Candidatus Kapabacteria bacterium]
MIKTLDYNIKENETGTKGPLMLMIHGYGANKNDLFGLKNYFPDNFEVISLQAPFELLQGGRHWYNIEWVGDDKVINNTEAISSKQLIVDYLNQIDRDKYSKIILLGFSQGAILSHAISLEFPKLVDITIAFSGYIDESIFNYSSNISNVEIFMTHGLFDEVIEVDYAKKSSEILNSKNVNHFFKIYPLAHSIDENIISDLLTWIDDKIK